MSAEKVIYTLLTAEATLTALLAVPGNVWPSTLPIETPLPAVNYEVISRMERGTVSLQEGTIMVKVRIQVDCHARDYETVVAMVAAVRKALANKIGTFAGVPNVVIRPEFQGIDVYNERADFYSRSSDFLVTLEESVS